MDTAYRDVAAHLLSLPQDDFDAFIVESLRERRLSKIVVRLNHQVLNKKSPAAKSAKAALERIGFPD